MLDRTHVERQSLAAPTAPDDNEAGRKNSDLWLESLCGDKPVENSSRFLFGGKPDHLTVTAFRGG